MSLNQCFLLMLFSYGVSCADYSLHVHQESYDAKDSHAVWEYRCEAYLREGDFLSWYQIKESKDVLLRRVQHTESISNWLNLTVHMTLQTSDNGTKMYCAKQMSLPGGGLSEGVKSDNVPINIIGRELTPLEKPYVLTTPDRSPVYFKVNTTHNFSCMGSKPVDGRKLMWFIQAKGNKAVYADSQTNQSETMNILTLRMDESYHQKELFCIQAFRLYPILNGTIENDFYNELARSKVIELRLELNTVKDSSEEEDSNEEEDSERKEDGVNEECSMEGQDGDSYFHPLPLLVTLGVVVVVSLVTIAVWLKCRKRQGVPKPDPQKTDNEECLYATAQVTYVELDLKQSNENYASTPAQETSPYTQIIGVYNPKLTAKRT